MQEKLLTQEEFMRLFLNTRSRYIHDVNKKDVIQGNNTLDMSHNSRGYGTFYTVNGFPSEGKADETMLSSLNANFVDIDFESKLPQEEIDTLIQEARMLGVENHIPLPTIINRTKKGVHMIWLYPEPIEPTVENIAKWKEVQKRIVQFFNGDTNAMDPARVLRLPYTLHLKNPNEPFEVKILAYNKDERTTLEELDKMVPFLSIESKTSQAISNSVQNVLLKGVETGQGLRHRALSQVAGMALRNAKTPDDVEVARLAVYGWDKIIQKSPESFTERQKEIDDTIDAIWKKEQENRSSERLNQDEKPYTVPRLWNIGEILKTDFGEEEWLIEYLVSKQGITAFSGNPGDFKTWVTIHFALGIARGLPVFGKFKTTQGGVLIIDEEDHIRLLKKRLGLLGAKEDDNIHYISQSGIKVDDERARDMIVDIVKKHNIKLVILDSLVRVHGQEENDAKGMARVFSSLQKVITAGASILFTHHHRKQTSFNTTNSGQSMRGSSDILAAVDCHITIERKKDEEDKLVIRQTKLRQAEALKPFEINVIKDINGPSDFAYAGDYDDRKKKSEEVAEIVITLLSEGMKNREEIHEILSEEYGKNTIDDGIDIAIDNEDIEKVPSKELKTGNKKKKYLRLFTGTTENDLPVSLPTISTGKQEEEQSSHDEIPVSYSDIEAGNQEEAETPEWQTEPH
ncbi:MAG: AAA family ATPase [Candidatus Pacebacteria bacterium]|nr:AAA family ATPase [Candidatus Paceibacterota bacterium]MBP9867190.1 AAA family ATPase [Candidatus Paceibacterota bacterium]